MLRNQPRAQPDKSETFTDSCSLGSSQVASKCLSRSRGSPCVISSLMPPLLRAKCAYDVFGVLVMRSCVHGNMLNLQRVVAAAPPANSVVAEWLAFLSLCSPARAFGPSRPFCCPFAPFSFSRPWEHAFQRCVGRIYPNT